MMKNDTMRAKDREALLFVKAVPVFDQVITRPQLARDLDITQGQLGALIYRMTWYFPIAEEVEVGLCWPDARYKEQAIRDLKEGRIDWMDCQKVESALRKRHDGDGA